MKIDLLTPSDLCWHLTPWKWLTFFLVLSMPTKCNMTGQNRSMSYILPLFRSMTPSDPIWHVTFNRWRPYMYMDTRNLLTNSDNHRSFPPEKIAFSVRGVTIYILTPSDPKWFFNFKNRSFVNAYGQKEYVDQFWRFLGHFTKLEMRFKWKSRFDLFMTPVWPLTPNCEDPICRSGRGSYWPNLVIVACKL